MITSKNQAVVIGQQDTPPEGCEHIEISLQSTTEKQNWQQVPTPNVGTCFISGR